MDYGLDWKALAMTGGLLWGGYLAFAALLEMFGIQFLMFTSGSFEIIKTIFPGIDASISGIILALVWGFLCAAVGLAIFAWFYNYFKPGK